MIWPWIGMLALGAAHGINPAMGWLFAVALGLQEGRPRAVWRALPPLALGHAAAIGAAAVVAAALGHVVSVAALERLVGLVLIGFGVRRLVRHRHPRFGGMQVGFRDLTVWSFLMASAHGAGLMVLPLLVARVSDAAHGTPPDGGVHAAHAAHAAIFAAPQPDVILAAAGVHAVGYLLVTAIVAMVFYYKLGLRLLRIVWVNVDLIWACALVATGGLTLLL